MHLLNSNKKKLAAAIVAIGILALIIPVAGIAMHHLLPPSWTGEAARLARILGPAEGASIAEIGAGSGAMAAAIAKLVGPRGSMLVTEIAPAKRARLGQLAPGAASAHLTVMEALEDRTNLPSGCCDGLYMRNVLHHVKDWEAYGKDLIRTVRPGGMVAIIDFPPGALFHLADDHGAAPDRVVDAFTKAGLRLEVRDDDWGGSTYLLAFRRR